MKKISIFLILLLSASFAEIDAQVKQMNVTYALEEIILQTDRDIYITGESIWFRADYFLRGERSENELSKSLYVELITPLGESVARHKYAITNGAVKGVYPIPEGLLTATYMLRAYTQFQRNFTQAYFTTNLITIINPAVPLTGYQDELRWKLRVFPENNGITNGTLSKLAFRVHPAIVDKLVNLKVVDQFGEKVTEVKPFQNGLAVTEFMVKDTLDYTVVAYFKNGDSIRQAIPKIEGKPLLNYEMTDGYFRFKLSIPEKEAAKDYTFSFYNGHMLPIYNQEVDPKDKWQEIELPEIIPDFEITYLVVRDRDANVVQVVSVFQMPEKLKSIQVSSSKSKYQTRSNVEVSVKSLGEKVDAYTMSVVKNGTLEVERTLIPDFVLENPQLLPAYLKTRPIHDEFFLKQLNALMLIYENMLKSDPSMFKETNEIISEDFWAPEMRGITIRGKVREIASMSTEADCDVYVAMIGDEPQLHVYKTNQQGEFIFTLKHVTGVQNIFLCVDSKKANELEIMINSDFVNDYQSMYTAPASLDTSMQKFISDLYVNAQIKAFHDASDSVKMVQKHYTPIRFPESSTSVLLDDYIALPTLREVLNEIVPYVKVQKSKDDFSLEVLDPVTNQVYGDPLVLIDNLPVFDIKELMKINPELIRKVSVINSTYVYGEHLFRGIVFLETNTNNFAGIELPVSSTFLEFQAVEELDLFSQVNHSDTSEASRRIPDFRNVLYWNPDLEITSGKETVSFATSDYEGAYQIIVRAMNKEGVVGIGAVNFTVRDE